MCNAKSNIITYINGGQDTVCRAAAPNCLVAVKLAARNLSTFVSCHVIIEVTVYFKKTSVSEALRKREESPTTTRCPGYPYAGIESWCLHSRR